MLFPSYTQGIPAFRLLILATMLGSPYSYIYNFIVASKGGLRPLLLITGASAAIIVTSSIALIPKFGIFGAATSQALVQAATAILVTLWAIKTRVLEYGKREAFISIATLTVVGAVYLEPPLFIFASLFILRFSLVINKPEYEALKEFIPKRMHLIAKIIEVLLPKHT
jgi:O-antigen/teichoic acid export membrane protein